MDFQNNSIEEEKKMPSPVKLSQITYCIVGNLAVGKTSMAKVFAGEGFSNKRMATLGVDYVTTYKKPTCLKDVEGAEESKIVVWDTAGAERHHSLAPSFY